MSRSVSVTLKIATSLDSRIALSNGVSQWITNNQSRACVHQMRADHDAVLVGIGTVLADDPMLTARTVPAPAKQPARIIADSRLRTPRTARLVASASLSRVILAHDDHADASPFDGCGVETWAVGRKDDHLDLAGLLRRCEAEGLNRIFLEGGGTLAASFIRYNLVDTIAWFRAPLLIGGDGVPVVASLGLTDLGAASRWALRERTTFGDDTLEIWSRT